MKTHQAFFDGNGIDGVPHVSVASNNFDVNYIRCEWKLDPAVRYIQGKVTFYFSLTKASDSIVLDLVQQLVTDSVKYHGTSTGFMQTSDDGLSIDLPGTLAAGTKDSVSIYYQGVPPASSSAFFQYIHGGVPVIYTSSEPYGSKSWWPCKNGLTDKADSIDIVITNPVGYTASTNGRLINEVVNGSEKTATYTHRYPIATYLVAIGITNYQTTTDTLNINGKKMEFKGYYYPESFADFSRYESFTKEWIGLFSKLFGDYPFVKEKYAQTQSGINGGMENQTNTFLGSRGPNLQAHELMHQWTGDLVTCGSWQHIWLNEGFATYGVLVALEYLYPAFYKDLVVGTFNDVVSQPGGAVFVEDTSSVSRIFSNRLTYNKGAYLFHMLRWTLGDSSFYRGMRRYFSDPAIKYGYAMTKDLQRNLEQESGKNLESFFQKWFYGEGYPIYKAEWFQNKNNWIKLKLSQATSHPSVSFFDMPVAIKLKAGTKETIVRLDNTFNGQEFWIDPGFAVDTVLIDPDLWLLSKNNTSVKIIENSAQNELRIFPIPSPDELTISLKNPTDKKLSMQLFNATGQLLLRKEYQTPGKNELFVTRINHLPRGVYVLTLKSEKNINIVKKIVH